jgi:methylenetetrahydrofolate--tRNA-(uracil-5-)-methyltransferase
VRRPERRACRARSRRRSHRVFAAHPVRHRSRPPHPRILRLIPGLENAKFLRYGQIHRNTYINAPRVLTPTLQMRDYPGIFFAGQISGVEGYTESIATGMLAGLYAAAVACGTQPQPAPRQTALGSLVHYITHAEGKRFDPANITFDLLVPLEEETRRKVRDKRERHRIQCERALAAFDEWWSVFFSPL